MSKQELLDQKVIYQRGPLQRVRRWWKGIHPERGAIIWGLTGWETVEEQDRIVPAHIFTVRATGRAAA
jgi:hypothetical protein